MEEENGESSYQTRLLRGERRMTLMNKKSQPKLACPPTRGMPFGTRLIARGHSKDKIKS